MVAASVIISNSKCIYRNLALEAALYDSVDLTNRRLLLLWSNGPSVVVGRHQCVWAECDVGYAQQQGIAVARRHSGGGTVYHDRNNLNLSFMTDKHSHDRLHNAQFIADCLKRRFGIDLTVAEKRQDLLLASNGAKVSGTAARITRLKAYHHLTLLVDVDRPRMSRALATPDQYSVESKATQSVRAVVGCLRDAAPSLTLPHVQTALAEHYALHNQPCSMLHWPEQQTELGVDPALVARHEAELRSWQHVFGLSPPFTLRLADAWLDVRQGRVQQCSPGHKCWLDTPLDIAALLKQQA